MTRPSGAAARSTGAGQALDVLEDLKLAVLDGKLDSERLAG